MTKKYIINLLRLILICSFILFTVSGSIVFAEVAKIDSNFDGKTDRWELFDLSGKLTRIEADRNFDGNSDMAKDQLPSGFLDLVKL
jgi:hypothetical protein